MRQSEGRTAVSNDRWKMSLSARDRVSAQFFKMTFGIWSGPHALWGLMALSNLHTPAVLMLISLIIGYCGGSRCGGTGPGGFQPSPCCHTPVNHSFSGGATSMLSCFLLLMYFQKGFELFVWSPWVMVLLMYSHSALRILILHVFLDEFVVFPVVCFLSFLIESSLSL